MADGESNLWGILGAATAAIGIGGTAAYVGYKIGEGVGHKDGYADGIADSKPKYDSLKDQFDALAQKVETDKEELKRIKGNVALVCEWAKSKGYIQEDTFESRKEAEQKLDSEILQCDNVVKALAEGASKDCARGVLRYNGRDWMPFMTLEVRTLLPRFDGETTSVWLKEPLIDFGDGIVARLDIPNFETRFPPCNYRAGFTEQRNVIEKYTKAPSLHAQDIVQDEIKRLDGTEIACGAMIQSSSEVDVVRRGAPMSDVMRVRSEWLENLLIQRLSAIWEEFQQAHELALSDIASDRAFLEQNDSCWIRIKPSSHRKCSHRWCKTLSKRFWYVLSGGDYCVEQTNLKRYSIRLVDAGGYPFCLVGGTIYDVAGLYKCKVIQFDHDNAVVYLHSEALIDTYRRLARVTQIERLEGEVVKRRYEMTQDRYNDRALDELYQRLSKLTGGDYDLERFPDDFSLI